MNIKGQLSPFTLPVSLPHPTGSLTHFTSFLTAVGQASERQEWMDRHWRFYANGNEYTIAKGAITTVEVHLLLRQLFRAWLIRYPSLQMQ